MSDHPSRLIRRFSRRSLLNILLIVIYGSLATIYVGSYLFLRSNSRDFVAAVSIGIRTEARVLSVEESVTGFRAEIAVPLQTARAQNHRFLLIIDAAQMRQYGIDEITLNDRTNASSVRHHRWNWSSWKWLHVRSNTAEKDEAVDAILIMTAKGTVRDSPNPLGFIRRIYQFPEFTIPADEWIGLGRGGDGLSLATEGWGQPEPGGRWTIGREAELSIRLPASASPMNLELQMRPYLPVQRPNLTMTLSSGERVLGSHSFDHGRPIVLSFPLPPGTGTRSEPVTFDLVIDEPLSPSSLGSSNDERRLGLFVQRLRIVETTDPPSGI